ncbi:MAG: GWxTD domain-containing protein [Flavobacteriia bacterium]|nr:GWxTD domain-containing protein [Flavobacteriia bacterium]
MSNKIAFILLVQLIFSLNNFSLSQRKNSLKAYVDFKQFYLPDSKPLLEIYIQFVGYSCKYFPMEDGIQAELFIKYQLNDSMQNVVFSDAYRMLSPIMKDSLVEDFYELKRINVPFGKYTFKIHIEDLSDKKEGLDAEMLVEVKNNNKTTKFSDIVIAENIFKTREENMFSKSGFDVYPRINNYFSMNDLYLPVYLELYNHTKDTIFGLKQSVLSKNTSLEVENLTRFTKIEVKEVLPMIRKIDISQLQTGEYTLIYSLIDSKMNEIATTSYSFEKSGMYLPMLASEENVIIDPSFQESITDDSLKYYISSLIPICSPAETKNLIRVLKTKNKEMYRKYIQNFWQVYAQNKSSYEEWMKYKSQVQLVHKLYKTSSIDGFETDRGRVYLKYGAPSNIINRSVSSGEVPFEIWRYDKIQNYSNRKFIFYDPDLINNYILLHSDVIGERKNPRWQQFIQKRNSYNTDVYDTKDGILDSFGNKSGEFINQY